MAFRVSHLSLALSLVALAFAGVAIYRNTYEAMNMGLQKLSPVFDLSESAVSILTLNNNVDQQNSHKLSQQSPESCVFSAVRGVVDSAIDTERRMGASLIRLHFHDCFVDGCDGGVLLDDIAGSFQGEQTSPPNNNSARGFEVIAQAKQSVKDTCPNISVSCADILAIAARDSVVKLGGQTYNIGLGRRDARTANFTGALTQLPAPFDNLTVQITKFSDKNFTVREMVALAGAHTVGFARCVTVCNSNNVNPAARLSCNCSVTQNNTNLEQLDTTPTVFDKVYYEDLNRNQGILFSDQVLTGNTTTAAIVTTYSNDSNVFFGDFAAAMIKMGNLPPSQGVQLEIRDVCSRVNPSSVASM
ncbi:PREDICTED: suberization-associated anionic peroxidase-like [Nicotiana attenuata]|uniref:Peroxidase n=1 Tax=Nicotiana attenuata TaxID=49451 RepID=A0A1J6KCY1_NICAT|nr:PREDICTED: suberization-associated anionic peroxidase-like [Nicotiana attenuata]OIT27922.1 suberization-associated anionic peroxidase [Nicotiana attenuata]